MISEPRDFELWMEEVMNCWAEDGQLPQDKSVQLHAMVARLAHQERRIRLFRTALGFAAALIACIWILFTSCPVAAAAYLGGTFSARPFNPLLMPALTGASVLILFRYRPAEYHNNFEVPYE